MISSKRAAKIMTEPDQKLRNEMIDKLTEEDAKYMLKVCIANIKGEGPAIPEVK